MPGEDLNIASLPKRNRGSGTVLLFLAFWWVLLAWWTVLGAAWILWLIIAGITTIFKNGFFKATWYYPWPAWTFGIR